jgi:hypothetical protein
MNETERKKVFENFSIKNFSQTYQSYSLALSEGA